MSLLVVGLNHRSSSTSILEKAAVAGDDVPKVLHDLLQGEHVAEAVVLSTCNRTEVYADVETFHGGVAEISDQLSRISGLDLADLSSSLYVHHEARAVGHLFSVVSGLDSMLVGETQILGQVRGAFRYGQAQGAVGRSLGGLFQTALRVGKRSHSETGIDAAGASIVSVGMMLAGPLDGRRVLLIGAGSVGSIAGAVARREGAAEIVVANRTADRAERLAATLNGRAAGLSGLVDEIARADLVVTSTGATGLVLTRDVLATAITGRDGRPLVLLDLALPRDVDPGVRDLPGVTLVDLDTLRAALDNQQVGRDVESVRALVAEEVAAFLDRRRAQIVAPTVVALRAQAAAVVADELDRLRARTPAMDERTRAEVETAVRRVADKLLHAPTVRVQQLAGAPGGDAYAEALRELFDLPREAPAVVSVPDLGDAP